MILLVYDHIHRARDQKMFWDPKIFKISKNNVYMIFYVKKLYHVKYTVHFIYIYIYYAVSCVYRERERKIYTH